MRILIVDDSMAMRRLEKKLLSSLGHTDVHEAADGLQALQAISERNFDLILMDWKMPILSGLETLKQLKSMSDFSSIPVVMVTSESQKPKILEAIQAGASNYIVKPFDEMQLKEKLSRFLKDGASVQAPTVPSSG